jgi:hypothetical protein
MKRYGGIDLHSNNSYIVLMDSGGLWFNRVGSAMIWGACCGAWRRIRSRSRRRPWSRPTTGTGWWMD